MDENTKIGIVIAIIVIILIIIIIYYFRSTKSDFYNGNTMRSDQYAGTKYQYKTAQEHELCKQKPEVCSDYRPEPINDAAQDTKSRGLIPNANQPDHTSNFWKSESSNFANIPDDTDSDKANFYYASKGKIINQSVDDISNQHIASRFQSEAS